MEIPTEGLEGRKRSILRRVYGLFGRHLKTYWKLIALAFAGLFGSILMNLAAPWPLKLILDYVVVERPLPDGLAFLGTNVYTSLTVFAAAMVALVFLQAGFVYVNKYFMAKAGHNMTNDIRQRVFDHLQALPQSFHTTSRPGDLVVRMTSDVNALKKLLITHFKDIAEYTLTFASIILAMLMISWRLALVALLVVPPLFLLSSRFAKKVSKVVRKKRTKESEVASIVQETMTSMAVVKAFNQEKREKKRFKRESDESRDADIDKTKLAGLFRISLRGVVALGTAVVVWIGAHQVLKGDLLPGDLVVLAAYLRSLYGPITGFSGLLPQFAAALVCAERIAEVLESESSQDAPDAVKAPRLRGEIVFENVTFGYKPDQPVLKNLSLTVTPGQTAALVGSSGTGKSTIVNLLLRFHEPWEGRILIDGTDVRRYTRKSLRKRMSVVLQESILFRRTIGENIDYGRGKSTREDIVRAAKAAQAHEFIMALPNGYDTSLEERGQGLSGGERQRISLARAILRNAPVLILDEPSTGLDASTEAELDKTLKKLMEGKTSLVIAHRFSTVKRADVILVIENGSVLDQGTHDELLARNEHYRKLYTLQYRDHEWQGANG